MMCMETSVVVKIDDLSVHCRGRTDYIGVEFVCVTVNRSSGIVLGNWQSPALLRCRLHN